MFSCCVLLLQFSSNIVADLVARAGHCVLVAFLFLGHDHPALRSDVTL